MTTPSALAPTSSTNPDVSIAYLVNRVNLLLTEVRRAVERRRETDPDPDDRFRGLYIPDNEVDDLLATDQRVPLPAPPPEAALHRELVEEEAASAEAAGEDLRLRRLARSFGLEPLDVELFVVALAPDVDPRFERLYAYLQDDVSRRRASVGLALELCGAAIAGPERRRFGPLAPLLERGLLVVEEPERPFLTRSLRVPDRVTAHLFGDDTPEPLVAGVLAECAGAAVGDVSRLAAAISEGARLCYVKEPIGGAGLSMATAALVRAGRPPLALDLGRAGADEARELGLAAAREAGLRGGGVVAGPLDALAAKGADLVRVLAELRCLTVLVGSQTWDPQWSREVPVVIEAAGLGPDERRALWRGALDGAWVDDCEPAAATAGFRLSPEQIVRAAQAACQEARSARRPMDPTDLRAGARAQNGAGLERLARRVEPRAAWDDLVLPPHVLAPLRELAARVRRREQVFDGWGLGRRSSKGRGVKALFAGDSGTGKTMSAEVVAADLGLDLYVIDLSTVVDKYVGETEKNLDRIFAEADCLNGVLLFDEADALFGKRSEVSDAQDRYANVEVAYLLQRMELFDGVAILTTNLRANLDEAFARRLDAIVDFPMPEEDDRLRLWEQNLGAGLPRADDVDPRFLAATFKISGGNIRNIVVGAAFLAAEAGHAVGMAELIRATEREYRKLGRLVRESEFAPYFDLVRR